MSGSTGFHILRLSFAKTGATLLSGTLANVSEVVAPMIALFGGPGVPTGACV